MSIVVPVFITVGMIYALIKRTPVYDSFSQGAKNGLVVLCNIFPPILAVMSSAAMLRASGMTDGLLELCAPILQKIGAGEDVMLLALTRPLSGGGALGMLGDILKNQGADSFSGLLASVIMGSTETTFYTLSVYFSKTKVKYTKMALPAAIFGDIVGLLASITVCKIFF